MKKNKMLFLILGIILVLIIIVLILIKFEFKNNKTNYNDVSEDGTFSSMFIRESHKKMDHKNYMISPYSVEIALSMLRDGASGDTLKEIESVVPKRSIKTLAINNKVNVANALFVKDIYKNDVQDSYYETLKNDYNAEILYDKFTTPDKINSWVNKETNGMIKKVVNDLDKEFVLGIANAVAMEEEWAIPFACDATSGYAFTKTNGKQYDTAMMSHSYESLAYYYKDDKSEVVTIPYKIYDHNTGEEADEGSQLDFVGILPKDIDSYINSFSLEELDNIKNKQRKASDNLEIYVGLPRFEFSYNFDLFKNTLIDMGIKDVFEPGADLSNMIKGRDVFVNDAVHKSYVKVNEQGTKAAAVTYFGVKNTSLAEGEKEYVSIIFDKPFIFMIKDHDSNEILFFGVVYEPEKWTGKKSCE